VVPVGEEARRKENERSMKKTEGKKGLRKQIEAQTRRESEETETHNTKQIIGLRKNSWPHPSSPECTALAP
jgi:hypothetical protein